MKQIFLLFLFIIVWNISAYNQDKTVYDYSIKTANNKQFFLKDYTGKKIIIVVIPVSQDSNRSQFLSKIDSIGAANQNKAVIIGIPSLEICMKNKVDTSLISQRNSLNNYTHIIFSKPVYTHKLSKTNQDNLFNWLTNASKNNHFDMEIGGVGTIYIINEWGQLNTVICNDSSNPNEIPLKIFAKF